MNPGLPGLGIGGLFYILSALAMPLVALFRAVRGAPPEAVRWSLALGQFAIAISIVFVMGTVFWGLEITLFQPMLEASAQWQAQVSDGWQRTVVRTTALLTTAGVLAGVLLLMQLTRLILARSNRGEPEAAEPNLG